MAQADPTTFPVSSKQQARIDSVPPSTPTKIDLLRGAELFSRYKEEVEGEDTPEVVAAETRQHNDKMIQHLTCICCAIIIIGKLIILIFLILGGLRISS